MIRVSGLLIEDMRTAVCIRFCVAAKEGGAGGRRGGKGTGRSEERAGDGGDEEKEQGERSVLPEGTKRQRVARRQDASGNGPGMGEGGK